MKASLIRISVCVLALAGLAAPQQSRAQSSPAPVGPQGLPVGIANGVKWSPDMWSAAWKSKADVNRIGGSDTGTDLGQGVASAVIGAFGRTVSERAGTDVQPHDFLSAGQNVSDLIHRKIDVGALINTAYRLGIKRLRLPCGDYRISTTIRMDSFQTLAGDGMCTSLYSDSPGDDVIDVSGQFDTIRDLRLVNAAPKTGGAVLAAYRTFHLTVEHFDIDVTTNANSWWNGIVLYGANDTHLNDTEIRPGGKNSGLQISGTADTGRSEDTYITHTNINGWANDLEISWGSGNYLSNMDILDGRSSGILFDPSGSQEVDGTRASQILSDSNIGDGWRFDGTGPVTETTLTNCWGSTNGYRPGSITVTALADGVHVINPATSNLSIVASEFHANTAHGIEIGAGKNILIGGNALFMNGNAGLAHTGDTTSFSQNTYYGVFVDTPASYVTITSNIGGLGGVENVGTTSHQRFLVDTASNQFVTIALNTGNTHWGGAVVNIDSPTTGTIVNQLNNGN